MQDGTYRLALFVDRHNGSGVLTMFGRNGQGHDGRFKIEVHVSGTGHDLRGVVNLLRVGELARADDLPHHFSLAVVGSGDRAGFNLIGAGPSGLLVEPDAQWRNPLPGDSSVIGPG